MEFADDFYEKFYEYIGCSHQITEEQLEKHLAVSKYDDFTLTDAIRPSPTLEIIPINGYKHMVYKDEETGEEVPLIVASVSKEKLFDFFYDLLSKLGGTVDVYLKTSHFSKINGGEEFFREDIDLAVLQSQLIDFEDLLLNDGFSGLIVSNEELEREIHFDDHKLLYIYSNDFEPFKNIFLKYDIVYDQEMRLIRDIEHIHSSDPEFGETFSSLSFALGAELD